jgi:hypothetical protein
MCPCTGLILGTTRTDKCVGYEIALQFGSGIRLTGEPQSSQINEIPERRMISLARPCACNQTDGSTPASLNTDMVRFTTEDGMCSWAESVFGKMPDATTKRPNIAVFMNPHLAGMRKSAASGWVPQGLTGNVRLKRR